MNIKDKINTLYYKQCYYCVPDNKTEEEAKQLKYTDVYTSNELVVLAARCLVKEKVIDLFFLVTEVNTYLIDENTKYSYEYSYSMYEKYLKRLIG